MSIPCIWTSLSVSGGSGEQRLHESAEMIIHLPQDRKPVRELFAKYTSAEPSRTASASGFWAARSLVRRDLAWKRRIAVASGQLLHAESVVRRLQQVGELLAGTGRHLRRNQNVRVGSRPSVPTGARIFPERCLMPLDTIDGSISSQLKV